MTLELHVWGPAFGLASLDPECLATIAYFTQALDRSEWKLVQSSPSAVPTHHLPALHTPTTPPTWTAGLTAITSQLRTTFPPTFRDPDAALPRCARADATAHAAHLRSAAAPLLALSLYASPSNWAAASRPALSAVLPVPLAWTEAAAVRARWVTTAERAGLAGLDVDAEEAVGEGATEQLTGRRDADGWIRGPKGLGAAGAVAKDAAAASAEARARARLDEAVGEVLDVLEGLRAGKRWFLGDGADEGSGPTTLDCLAFGYLALMHVPDLPRQWLRDAMKRRYGGLCSFVDDMQSSCFGGMVTALPWSPAPAHDSAVSVALRFARGAVRSIPGVGEEWQRLWEGRRGKEEAGGADLLMAAGGILAAAAIVTGFVFRKDIPALGEPIQRWERPQTGLRAFGAAGALLGFASEAAGAADRRDMDGGGGFGGGGDVAASGNSQRGPVVVQEKTPIGEVEVAVDVRPGTVN